MPRRTRMYIPGLPYHVVQRGNNRAPFLLSRKTIHFTLGYGRHCQYVMLIVSYSDIN